MTERFTGRVKWFNSKNGYGFITVTDGEKAGTDVFVHHSAIQVGLEQYKYLIQGEYVEFTLVTSDDNTVHQYHVGEVHGIKGGKLMCETRYDASVGKAHHRANENSTRKSKTTEKQDATIEKPTRKDATQPTETNQTATLKPKQKGVPSKDEGEWSYVSRVKKSTQSKPLPKDKGSKEKATKNKATKDKGTSTN